MNFLLIRGIVLGPRREQIPQEVSYTPTILHLPSVEHPFSHEIKQIEWGGEVVLKLL